MEEDLGNFILIQPTSFTPRPTPPHQKKSGLSLCDFSVLGMIGKIESRPFYFLSTNFFQQNSINTSY